MKEILNGPYLLAPKTTEMTLVWECAALPPEARVVCCEKDCEASVFESAVQSEDNGDPLLQHVVLRGLKPGKRYVYKIFFAACEIAAGEFKTLEAEKEELNLITLTDSHAFKVADEFAAVLKMTKPDLILHSGDISRSTGFQKSEYQENWFQKGKDFLSEFPVAYTIGNHDEGPYYRSYFGDLQEQAYGGQEENYAFSYAGVRFIVLNSNPWGLAEMNAYNAGIEAEPEIIAKIERSLTWLEGELASSAAREAAWRVLMMHHPYTDDFSQKHIVKRAEEGKVDLVLAGHLHYYMKNISADPKIGAKMIYLSQGSAEEACGERIEGDPLRRILPAFPELLAEGSMTHGRLQISRGRLVYKACGIKEGREFTVDEMVIDRAAPQISLKDVEIEKQEDGWVRISGRAENKGAALSLLQLELLHNDEKIVLGEFGEPGQTRLLALNGSEEREFSCRYRIGLAGLHRLEVAGKKLEFALQFAEALRFENLRAVVGSGDDSDLLKVSLEAVNQWPKAVRESVALKVDEERVAETLLDFAAGERRKLEMSYRFSQGGVYRIAVGTSPALEITIEGALCGAPYLPDLSGNENHGFLRGRPRMVVKDGKAAFVFSRDGDCIEVPDDPSLHVRDAYTGLVEAKINRLAGNDEMGHNPLMVKGASLGWGATYLLRMVVERNGNLKWGTCYDSTEYTWQGGSVNLGGWTKYVSAFDCASGGASYCDAVQVAASRGLQRDVELRNWQGRSLFIGYSYIGHVIWEIDRPKYFTQLAAQIAQVRFYKEKLNAEEVALLQADDAAQPKKELAVWLDAGRVEKAGEHCTEWRFGSWRRLRVKAKIPQGTELTALLEISQDKEELQECLKIELGDGETEVSLPQIQKGHWFRIRSRFVSYLGEAEMELPQLESYRLEDDDASDVSCWGTRKDWERGTFSGAVGFQPIYRTKVFEEYTDIIHG